MFFTPSVHSIPSSTFSDIIGFVGGGVHRNANGVGVNGEGVKTIKAIKTIKTIKTIQTPKTCMRTRKLSSSYRKTIEKLQFNE